MLMRYDIVLGDAALQVLNKRCRRPTRWPAARDPVLATEEPAPDRRHGRNIQPFEKRTTMKRTLYDVLEVSTTASPAAIKAAYERIRANHAARLDRGTIGPEQIAEFNLVKDAFATLSSAQSRAAYDAKTLDNAAADTAVEFVEPPARPWVKVSLIAIAVLGGGWYFKAQSDAKAEMARIEAENRRIEAENTARQRELDLQAERDARQNEAREARQNEVREARERDLEQRRLLAEQQRAQRDADRYATQTQYSDSRAKNDADRQQREAENRERMERYEAQRRVDREKQAARQLEYERTHGRPSVSSIPSR